MEKGELFRPELPIDRFFSPVGPNDDHLAVLKSGVDAWNEWRAKNLLPWPDLSRADLTNLDLRGADLRYADLRKAQLAKRMEKVDLRGALLNGVRSSFSSDDPTVMSSADLRGADLSETRSPIGTLLIPAAHLILARLEGANLSNVSARQAYFGKAVLSRAILSDAILDGVVLEGATLDGADLSRSYLNHADLTTADLTGANLSSARLNQSDLSRADLSRANLHGTDLTRAILIGTKLDGADLSGCSVYGLSAWDLSLKNATQSDLVITPPNEPVIQVDNLEVAQFLYLLLNNEKIREVLDTITSKVVLILGRFTVERKKILDAIRSDLRARDYLPVLFDFERPASRDITETISTLAHMARFVIADISDAKAIHQELERIVPDLPSVPIQPLLLASEYTYAMFDHIRRYPWVLEPYVYEDQPTLLAALRERVIAPAEAKAKEQILR